MASSIDILVPAARPVVGEWSDLTPAAAEGMPPHVTLLWPWFENVTPLGLARLADVVSELHAFELVFSAIGRFPGVLYLAPSSHSQDELVSVMRRIWSAFPETPPYAGQITHEPVPHLTVAKDEDDRYLDQVAGVLGRRLREALAIQVDRICVSQQGTGVDGRWSVVTEFALPA